MEHCERFTALLAARLDGELNLEEEQALEAHLAQCPDCRALAAELGTIHSAFPDLEEIPAPEGFARGVMDRVRASENAGPKVVPLFRRPQLKALAGLAACFVLCLGVYQAGLLGLNRQESANLAAVPSGQTAEEGQPSPSLFAVSPAEAGTSEPDSESPVVPQSRDLAEMEKKTTDGETAEGPVAVQSQMSVLGSPDSGCYSFANDQYIRVSYGHTPQAPSVRILDSADSLTAFLAKFPEDDLSQVSGAYGEDFFHDSCLLVILVEESSGSIRHELTDEGLEQGRITVLRQAPEDGTCDMAAWLILAEVDGSFRDRDTLTVVFQDQ